MKKIVAILMAMLMVMSVTITVTFADNPAREKQPEKIEQQIFEHKELNVLGEEEFVPNEIIVKFKHGVGKAKIDRINSKHGAFVRYTSPYTKSKRIAIPKDKTVPGMVKLYQAEDAVEYAEPNYYAYALMVPNDEYYHYQWHLDNAEYGGIGMEGAWDISTGDPSVVVAIVDTGIAYENYKDGRKQYCQAPDLANTCFVAGYDFVNGDRHPNDDNSHGTHVAGTVAQSTNNNLGVAGVAFDACLMPVKVLDSRGSGTYADVADGIIWAADNGAQVISLSLGGSAASETLENAVAHAYNTGVTVIAAAGNGGSPTLSYPAAYDDYVIAVGATQYDENLAPYSNYGPSLDLVAPGGNNNLDQNDDGYADGVLQQTFENSWRVCDFSYWFFQGTSMATPHVSGVAALLIANGNANIPDEVRSALQETAEDLGAVGRDDTYGHGLVDAYTALQWTATPNTPPVANADGPYTGTEGVAVTFDGSGSSAADGDSLTYSWDFGDGSTGTGVSPTHTYESDGTYTVTLTVNDGKVDSDPSVTTASISDVDPVASFTSDSPMPEGEVMTFTDTSTSYEGILLWSWSFGDGETSNEQNPTHVYAQDGTYTVTLTVTESDGDTSEATQSVIVTDKDPIASFTYSPANPTVDETISFTDTSTSCDGITSWSWDFGDEGTSSVQNPTQAYTSVGTYTVNLIVTEADGDSNTATAQVKVTEAPANTMHVASIVMSTTKYKAKGWFTYATATVKIVDANGDPVNDATVCGTWNGLTSGTASGTTDVDGQATLYSDSVKNARGTFTFTVDDVAKNDWTYNSSANEEISDSITVP